ncbi:hypothetical protein ACFS07_06670 [Undibacterium arcticum]
MADRGMEIGGFFFRNLFEEKKSFRKKKNMVFTGMIFLMNFYSACSAFAWIISASSMMLSIIFAGHWRNNFPNAFG